MVNYSLEVLPLTKLEQDLAKFIGNKRSEVNAERLGPNVSNLIKKSKRQSKQEIDVDGAAGEIAFAKMMGLYPNLYTDGPEKKADYVVNTKKIEVKTSRWNTAHLLLLKSQKEFDIDLYVLLTGTFSDGFRFAGAITKKDFVIQENYRKFKTGNLCYNLPQSALPLDFVEFTKYLNSGNVKTKRTKRK
tara:strand:- start:2408 stop:2971 length:564 start_codon:yes stop_codon:yes gene_type:complete